MASLQPPSGFIELEDTRVFRVHFPQICLGPSSCINVKAFGLEINQGPVSARGDDLGFYVGNVEPDESVYDVGDNSSARGGLAKVGNLGMEVFAHAKSGSRDGAIMKDLLKNLLMRWFIKRIVLFIQMLKYLMMTDQLSSGCLTLSTNMALERVCDERRTRGNIHAPAAPVSPARYSVLIPISYVGFSSVTFAFLRRKQVNRHDMLLNLSSAAVSGANFPGSGNSVCSQPLSSLQHRAMHKMRQHPSRSPFQQGNSSKSSLEGLEKPVRSFKSFIKSVPPHPTLSKPLPPVPPECNSSPPSTPRERLSSHSTPPNQSPNPWEAPAEWLDPRRPTVSDHNSESNDIPKPSPPRTYSPILPEASPDTADDAFMDFPPPQGRKGSNNSRLSPVPESRYSVLGAPRTPPRSPLPEPPNSGTTSKASQLSIQPNIIEVPNSNEAPKKDQKLDAATISPRAPPASSFSPPSSSTKATPQRSYSPAKGLAVLGQYTGEEPRERTHLHLRDRKATGQSDTADGWENESSQNAYHHLLVDQYKGKAIGVPKLNHTSTFDEHGEHERDQTMLPRPLSWQKNSSGSASRQESPDKQPTIKEEQAEQIQKLRRGSGILNAFKRPKTQKYEQEERSPSHAPELQHEKAVAASFNTSKNKKKIRKHINPDHRFSAFYPRTRPLNLPRVPKLRPMKRDKTQQGENDKEKMPRFALAQPIAISSSRTASPLPRDLSSATPSIHLPSRPQSPPYLSPSAQRQTQRPESGSVYSSSGVRSSNSNSNSPHLSSSPSQGQTSHTRNISLSTFLSTTPPPPTPAPTTNTSSFSTPRPRSRSITGIFEKLKVRSSHISSHSRQSTGSSYSHHSQVPPSSQPIPQVLDAPGNNWDSTTELSEWRKAHPDDDKGGERKMGLFEKAMETRKKKVKEGRQEKLKKSIRVLGPTDPMIVEGFGGEERRPGYLGLGSDAKP
ncbi:hypothetical protein BU16DRAFT_579682 [Lophium mytilinum]|uniref:Uncharacterized protein n=1 Tax=Lophium mytilinum TaxID=390894 RepID=A0A6A6R2J2_9PEZI|nr:hypothetical protein BU16DRAFT_579682 [Lophium mytilinum]